MKKCFLSLCTVRYLVISIVCCSFFSCAVAHPVTFLCSEDDVEMFVDDESIGTGLVSYVVPKGTKAVRVSCKRSGVEIYSRTYTIVGNKNMLYEVTVPKDYHYSNSRPEFRK